LAVHATSEVHDGQIVVARLGDEVTVKRLASARATHGSNRLYLLPENPASSRSPSICARKSSSSKDWGSV
jgi:repressor LexA